MRGRFFSRWRAKRFAPAPLTPPLSNVPAFAPPSRASAMPPAALEGLSSVEQFRVDAAAVGVSPTDITRVIQHAHDVATRTSASFRMLLDVAYLNFAAGNDVEVVLAAVTVHGDVSYAAVASRWSP